MLWSPCRPLSGLLVISAGRSSFYENPGIHVLQVLIFYTHDLDLIRCHFTHFDVLKAPLLRRNVFCSLILTRFSRLFEEIQETSPPRMVVCPFVFEFFVRSDSPIQIFT
ncbi:hypothetical protein GALMADRAFT_808541 [Galerina marginata CBS 339.88]|uniref:Uncharacterized protein n=1 Tax=Galerina marginata (strain CBS 339.88) TaxID=685588 RepID=A0A067SWK9_GALM3|nr:hypothetical protein GALMADRAFT_808541 [Galerina marginata CBS 339.88]